MLIVSIVSFLRDQQSATLPVPPPRQAGYLGPARTHRTRGTTAGETVRARQRIPRRE